jgi:GAF domain-containing protein
MPDRLYAAVAAGVMASEEDFTRLLRSIVEVARAIFGAQGSSIFLLDEESDELVFAAVAGEQDQVLVGQRFPSSTGIAGWVASTQTPLVLEDVQADPRFARDIAERSGYVPNGIMAVPLLDDERVLGVLQVLDRPTDSRFSLQEMELLGLFAAQAAIALSLLATARSARAAIAGDERAALVAKLAGTVDGLDGEQRAAADVLLRSLAELLAQTRH